MRLDFDPDVHLDPVRKRIGVIQSTEGAVVDRWGVQDGGSVETDDEDSGRPSSQGEARRNTVLVDSKALSDEDVVELDGLKVGPRSRVQTENLVVESLVMDVGLGVVVDVEWASSKSKVDDRELIEDPRKGRIFSDVEGVALQGEGGAVGKGEGSDVDVEKEGVIPPLV